MTNPTPNDLSPQGEHAPGPKPLSPSAMAVLDAFLNGCICNSADNSVAFQADRNGLAAALRALADQVVPHPGRYPMNEYMLGIRDAKQDVRAEFLAIATNLEAQP